MKNHQKVNQKNLTEADDQDINGEPKLIKIGDAAQVLGVSIDTLRRWEDSDKLLPVRTPGGTRLYSPFVKIGKAAKTLGVSIDTLRRWEKAGKLNSIRTPGGTRFYSLDVLQKFNPNLVSEQRPTNQPEALILPKETKDTRQESDALKDFVQNSGQDKTPQVVEMIIAQEWKKFQNKQVSLPQPRPEVFEIPSQEEVETVEDGPEDLSQIYAKIHTTTAILAVLSLFVILSGSIFFSYLVAPQSTKRFFSQDQSTKKPNNLMANLLFPFNNFSQTLYTILLPQKALQLGLGKPLTGSNNLDDNLVKELKYNPSVLAAAVDSYYLEINTDTAINGSLAVDGEGVFSQSVIAPNLIYGIVAGSGIAVSAGQTPTISSTDTLASVTARGATTSVAITLGNILNLGQLSSDPSSAINGATYYNTANNKFRCYQNGSWKDCDTDTTGTATGDITAVSTGNGLSGGASSGDVSISLDVTTSGTTTTTSANSGLETDSTGLSLLRGCSDTQVLKWNATTSVWECGSPAAIVEVQESGSTILATASILNFDGGDFDFTTTGTTTVNAQLAPQLQHVTGVAGSFDVPTTLTVGTADAFQVSATGGITATSLTMGGIGLGNTGSSNTTSGAYLVGVYDEFSNSNAATVQGVLNDLDAAIGGGASKWTFDAGGFTYLSDTTSDLVVGASTTGGASLYHDTSAGTLYLGTNQSLNGGLTLYSSGVGITDPTIVTDSSGRLIITSSNFNTTTTGINSTAIGATTASTGAFTTLSASSSVTFSNLSTGIAHLNASGVLSSSAVGLGTTDVTGTLGISNGGTGLTSTPTNGQLLIGNGSGYTLAALTAGTGIGVTNGAGSITISNTGVTSLTGTANQVTASASTGDVTLSLPQNIHTAATPTFASMTLSTTSNQLTLGTTNTTTISSTAPGSSRTYTIPDFGSNDTFVGIGATQTLTNKTLTDNTTLLQDEGDTSKKLAFQLSGIGTSTTRTLTAPNANGTIITTGNLTDITAVGTVASGTWNGTEIGAIYGGTGQTTVATGNLLYGSGSNTWSRLGIGSTGQVLTVDSGIPAWTTVTGGLCPTCVITNPSSTQTITHPAGVSFALDSASTASTLSSLTAGVFDVNVVSTTSNNVGFTLDYASNNGVAAAGNLYASRITVTQNDTDGNLYGMVITNGNTTAGAAASTDDLLVLSNADTSSADGGTIDNALRITSSGATITDAIDVSSSNITNAINLGGNKILGTTAVIDFNNFDVDGSGNLIAGTYNSQTISSAASFTGTVSVVTSVTSPIYTGTGAVTLSSAGGNALTLDSSSATVVIASGDNLQLGSGTISSNNQAITIDSGSANQVNLGASDGLTNSTWTISGAGAVSGVTTIIASGAITAATNETINGIDINAGTVSDVVNLTINAGGDLTIGTIGLGSTGTSNTTSGAYLVGAYDEFAYSSSTTVQGVLNDLDAAIAGSSSKWTQGSGFTYLTQTTDDVAIGATTTAASSFYHDTSAGTLYLGTNQSLNGGLTLYSSGVGITDPTLVSDASGNLVITANNFRTTTTGINNTAIGTTTASTGAFTTLSSSSTTTLASGAGAGTTIGNATGTFELISSGLDVSTAGALSGITTINASGAITAATNETINGIDINAGTVSDVVNLTINAGGDLTIGTIGLGSTGTSNTTSGAYLVGVYDEFTNSSSATVQAVLKDFDAAMGSGASKWTITSNVLHPNTLTDSFAVGTSSTATAPFAVSVSNNTVYVGDSTTAGNTTMTFKSNSGASTGNLLYNTSDQFEFSGGNVLVDQTLVLSSTANQGISGGGLVDCDDPSASKILWDSATNKFSCGVDSGSGTGSSKWTDSGTLTYMTSTTDDVAVGSTSLVAPFSVDVSTNTLRVGIGASADATLAMYASDNDTGSLIYNTSDQFQFSNGDILVDQLLSLGSYSLTASSSRLSQTTTFATTTGSQSLYGTNLNITNNPTGSANTGYGYYVTINDSGGLANTVYGGYFDVTTANGSDTAYGLAVAGDTADILLLGGKINSNNVAITLDSGSADSVGLGTSDAFNMSGNFSQTGVTTFGTGTGAVSINGNTTFASGTTITQSGTGQVSFGGNVDTTNGLDVTGANFTVGTTNFTVVPGSGNTTIGGTLGTTGLITASGGLTLAANQNLTLNSGTGTITQTYSNNTGSSATFNVTNSSNNGTNTVNALNVALTGTVTTGTNTNNALNLADVTDLSNNTFNAINVGGGYDNLLVYESGVYTGTLVTAGLNANRIYTLPDASGTICLSTNNCTFVSSFYVSAESGSNQTITTGDTLAFNAGTGIDTVASATDTVTISVQSNSLDFAQFQDTLDLDASLTFNQTSYTWTQNYSGTGNAVTIAASSTGTPLALTSSSTGTLLDLSATSTGTTPIALKIANTSSGAITTAIDVSDAEIGIGLSLGNNDVAVGGATISPTEFALLDGRSGTLVDTANVSSYATTGVTAGNGLTGGGTVGVLTLDVGVGTGLTAAADSIAIDTSVVPRKNVAETITGGWTFNTAATTFTTSINANGGITTTSGNLSLDSAGGTTSINDILSVTGTINGLTVSSGTISSGTWNGTAIGATYGGTGQTSVTSGDLLYGSAINTWGRLGVGTTAQVLAVNSGQPTWTTITGTLCPTCVITNPSSTQTITPTSSTATGLAVAQASSGSVDIFDVTSNGGGTTYFKVDSSGNTTLNGAPTITGDITFSATTPNIAITNGETLAMTDGSNTLFSLADSGTYGTLSVGKLTASQTSNQITLGTTNTTTLSATAPSTSRTYTIPDFGANDTFVGIGATQTLTYKTLSTGSTWNGNTITVPYGGTGATTLTTNGVLLGNGTSAVTATTAGSAYQVLRVPLGGGAPAFGSINLDQSAAVTGTLGISNGGTGLSTTPTNGQLLIGNGSGYTLAALTGGSGISVSNGVGSSTLSLGSLTADWVQSGAFDIKLANASSELLMMESTGSTYYGTLDIGDLSADATYTFSGTSGTVLTSANYSSYGDITAVGSMTSGDAFADSSASGQWLGLGSTAGRIAFDDQSTDYVNILSANLGIGTTSPTSLFSVGAASEFQVNSSGAIAAATGITSSGTITFSGLSAGGLVKAGAGTGTLALATAGTDYIAGGVGSANQVAYFSSSGVLTGSNNFWFDGTKIGIGTTNPGQTLTVNGTFGILEGGASPTYHTIFTGGDQSGDINYTLPTGIGTSGQVLATSGSGTMVWATGGTGTGDITAVGSMTSGDVFADSSASGQWLGLGSTAGRIAFDDQSTDYVNILAANVGIGSTAPSALLSVGSGNLFQVNSSGYALLPDGLVGTPSLSFTGDTDTGLYRPGDNSIAFAIAGVERMLLDSNGYLRVFDSSGTKSVNVYHDGTNGVITSSSGEIGIGTSGTNVFVEPSLVNDSANNDGYVQVADRFRVRTSDSGALAVFDNTGTGALLVASSSGTAKFLIDTNGKVGIGTTSPNNPLEIVDTSGAQLRLAYDTSNYMTAAVSSTGAVTFDAFGSGAGFTFSDNVGIGGTMGVTGAATLSSTLTLPSSNTLTGVASYTQFSNGISVGGATTYYINSSGTANLNAGTFAGTLTANGVATIGDGGDAVTLSGTTVTLTANTGNLTLNLIDNDADALDIQQGTDDYINIDTLNGSENISFGNAVTNPSFSFLGSGTVTTTGSLAVNGNTTLGNASGDTVTANADAWTFANDTNFVLSGGVNGLSFDTSTLSIDATSNRVGIGTTGPGQTLTVEGTLGILEGGSSPTYHTIFTGGDQSGDINYTLPTGIGTSGQVLATSGSGTMAWANGTIGTGTSNYVARWTGSGSLGTGVIWDDGANVGIGTTNPGAKLDILSSATSGTDFKITNSAAMTGTVASIIADSLTSGTVFDVSADGLTGGKIMNLTSTSTALNTGGLMALDWSPTGSTVITTTGDLFSINIGQYGQVANLFNIKDSGSSIFSVSETAVTSALPAAFNASGDVSIAYDISFTNPTSSSIKSQAPIIIASGETFNSSDLTLQTYNQGSVVINQDNNPTAAATSYALQVLPSLTSSTAMTYTALYGTYTLPTINHSGSNSTDVTTAYGNYVGLTATTGTIGTWYGNYIAAPTGSGTTTFKYALATEANAGNVGIGTISPGQTLTVEGTLGILEGGSSPTYHTIFTGGDQSGDINYTLPTGIGTSGQVLATSGSGTMAWANGTIGTGTSNYVARWTGSGSLGTGVIWDDGANVGIGTTNPLRTLDVNSTIVKFGDNTTNPILANNGDFAIGSVGTGTTQGRIWVQSQGTTFRFESTTNTADYSEFFYQGSEGAEPGDLMVVDNQNSSLVDGTGRVAKSTTPYQNQLVGVVTENGRGTGYNNPDDNRQFDATFANVGMLGHITVKVSTESGAIKRGDFITSSSQPGIGMRAVKPGQVVGTALEDYDGSNVGKIMAAVSPSFADPNNFLASLSFDNQGNLIVPSIQAENITVNHDLAVNGALTVAGANIVTSSSQTSAQSTTSSQDQYIDLSGKVATLEERIAQLESKIATSSAYLADLQTNQATASATPSAQVASATSSATPEATSSANMASLNLTPPDLLLATASATLANLNITSEATFSGKLTAYQAVIQDNFKSLGETILGKTTIAGDLAVDGTTSITGNSLDSIGTLFIQNSLLAKGVDFFNGLVTINKDGTVALQKLVVADSKVLGSSADPTIGSAKILAGQTNVVITNNQVTNTVKIFVTPRSRIGDQSLVVDEITPGTSFKVSLDHSLTEDINFDWWIIETK